MKLSKQILLHGTKFFQRLTGSICDLWCLFSLQIKLTVALARIRVFIIILFLILVTFYCVFCVQQNLYAPLSPGWGFYSVLFLVERIPNELYKLLILAVIFSVFDSRTRDGRVYILDSLQVHPYSNLSEVAARTLAPAIVVWFVFISSLVFLQLVGFTLNIMGIPFAGTIEPISLVWLAFVDVFPLLFFWSACTVLISCWFKPIFSLILVAILILLESVVLSTLSIDLHSVITPITTTSNLVSDIVTSVPSVKVLFMRICSILGTVVIVLLASLVISRRDSCRFLPRCICLLSVGVISLTVVTILIMDVLSSKSDQERWTNAHHAMYDEARLSLTNVSGVMRVSPPKPLYIDFELGVKNETESTLDLALFSLNPAMKIEQLAWNGNEIEYDFEHGLLSFDIPGEGIKASDTAVLYIRASGIPSDNFAYLDTFHEHDSSYNRLEIADAILGSDSYVFDPAFVLLTPSIRWFPMPGANLSERFRAAGIVDYFMVDIKVVTPNAGWTLVGGTNLLREGNESRTFRYAPPVPLPTFALIASDFHREAIELEGLNLELFVHRKHTRNLVTFASSKEPIVDYLRHVVGTLKEAEIELALKSYALVEVPRTYRVIGDGWMLPSTLSFPGIVLMRESGFPTTNFEHLLDLYGDQDSFLESSPELLFAILERYFTYDFAGGNVFSNAAKQPWMYSIHTKGRGSESLDRITQFAMNRLFSERQDWWSAYSTLARMDSWNFTIRQNWRSILESFTSRAGDSLGQRYRFVEVIEENLASRSETWELLENQIIADYDLKSTPRVSMDALNAQSHRLVQLLFGENDKKLLYQLLSRLQSKYRYDSYSWEDFREEAHGLGIRNIDLMWEWIDTEGLAGFLFSNRLESALLVDDSTRDIYEASLVVSNDQTKSGIFALLYPYDKDDSGVFVWSDPEIVRMEGKSSARFHVYGNYPIERVYINPVLSLNRQPTLILGTRDASKFPIHEERKAFRIDLEFEPENNAENRVVVDDLDDGFRIEQDFATSGAIGSVSWSSWGERIETSSFDYGLPVRIGRDIIPLNIWTREYSDGSWGRYRKTHARVFPRKEFSRASFQAELPGSGVWQLDYHLPWIHNDIQRQYPDIRFVLTGEGVDLAFWSTGADMVSGWNRLQRVSLSDGEITLSIVDVRNMPHPNSHIVADAIRWTKLED